MTTFSRTIAKADGTYILPMDPGWPSEPGPLTAFGQTGKGQVRGTAQVGRSWTEVYPPLKASDPGTQQFLALLRSYYRTGAILSVDHQAKRTLLGAGGGTPLVNGASQTGTSLITDGWPNTTAVLKAGDLITVASMNVVQEVTATGTSNGSGQLTLSITPGYFAGTSPADNAAITTNATPGSVLWRTMIVGLQMPTGSPDGFMGGVAVTFREMP